MKYLSFGLLIILSYYQIAYGNEDIKPVEWDIPETMQFQYWGFSAEEIADIAGNDQIVINGDPKTIHLWTKKYNRPVEYKDARIAYSATILDASPEMIRSIILHFSGKKPFKMIENLEILKHTGNHTMIRYE